MLADAHRQAAEDIEKTIVPLQSISYAARVVIEGREPGEPRFTGSLLVVKRNIKVIRRATLAWDHFFVVKEKTVSPNGGRI